MILIAIDTKGLTSMAKKKMIQSPRNLSFDKALDLAETWYETCNTGFLYGSPEEDMIWKSFFDTAEKMLVLKEIDRALGSSLSYFLKYPEEPSALEQAAYDETVNQLYDAPLTNPTYSKFVHNLYYKNLNRLKQAEAQKKAKQKQKKSA